MKTVINWLPIEEHDGSENECLIAIFHNNKMACADCGSWEPPTTHQEWEEVEDDVLVKIDEWQDGEGRWTSDHGIIEEPTHFAEITARSTAQDAAPLVEALRTLLDGSLDVSGTALILSENSDTAKAILISAREALAKYGEQDD